MSKLILANLTKSYLVNKELHPVLNDISCTADCCAITVVLGKSGCGKTTLLRLICGLEKPDSGSIVNPDNIKIGMMFQEARLMPWLTCEENITFGLNHDYAKKRIADLLTMVGLTEFAQSYPGELSGGMQQRAALARTLACDNDLILMDEPFAALDYFTRQAMQKEVLQIKETSHSGIIFVTHNIDEALLLADRILILKDGSITQDIVLPNNSSQDRDLLDSQYIALKRQILAALQIDQ